VVLELPNMVKRDKVFKFVIGLKPWAGNEVKRQKIKTLNEAFVVVDQLVEHYDEASNGKKKFDKMKEKKKDHASKSDEKSKMKKPLKCSICAEPHTVKNCLFKLKVAAIAQSNAKREEPSMGLM